MNNRKKVLPLLIISQFLTTSLWFAGNSILNSLVVTFDLPDSALSYNTSAVQLGFILGTLTFALFSISDKYAPSKIFFVCALAGSICNLGIIYPENKLYSILGFRFATGFFLAGIYPIGMKIAADYYDNKLGKSLGFLVGALVLGTSFPHFIKLISVDYSWEFVIISTSALATIGGLLIVLFVPTGPHFKSNLAPNFKDIITIFKNKKFSQAAVGYFGHMWELYAFWTFVPIILSIYNNLHPETQLSIPFYSFIIIGIGSLACISGGYLSEVIRLKKTATFFLITSGTCCLISPFIFSTSPVIFIGFLVFWGFFVIGDSPLFSTLVAKNTEPQNKGTALTIVNCIGFSITIISIEILSAINNHQVTTFLFLILAIGPIIGVVSLLKKV